MCQNRRKYNEGLGIPFAANLQLKSPPSLAGFLVSICGEGRPGPAGLTRTGCTNSYFCETAKFLIAFQSRKDERSPAYEALLLPDHAVSRLLPLIQNRQSLGLNCEVLYHYDLRFLGRSSWQLLADLHVGQRLILRGSDDEFSLA